MPEQKYPKQTLTCKYCGEKTPVRISPSDLDFEGNNPSMRVNNQQTRGKLQTFTCQWCKRKNIIGQ